MLLLCPANNFAAFSGQRQQEATGEGRPAAAPRFETEQTKILYTTAGASGISVSQRVLLTLQSSNIVAMRTCVELEPEALPRLPTFYGKPVVPFGLLPPSPDGGRAVSKDGNYAIMSWLDAQPAESVVYVALGSEVPLNVGLVHELALGLELAGTRFLWALRMPSGVLDADVLPPGFGERTRGRGLVTMVWVPQISILAHGAVGAFLTHCGWNSMFESLCAGVPMLCWPTAADQQPNSMYACTEWHIGMGIDENVGREEVERAVREVMGGEKGKDMRSVAMEWKEKIDVATLPGGSSWANLERVVDEVIAPLMQKHWWLKEEFPPDLVGIEPPNSASFGMLLNLLSVNLVASCMCLHMLAESCMFLFTLHGARCLVSTLKFQPNFEFG